MSLIRYLLILPLGVLMSLIAIIFSPLLALFVDKNGNLPWQLSWFQTPDAPAWGDASWAADNPNKSKWWLAQSWLRRNPAYGFNEWCKVSRPALIRKYGAPVIADGSHGTQSWQLYIGSNNSFQFVFILDLHCGWCIRGEYGWYLEPWYCNFDSRLAGALEVTFPFRFYQFSK